jgi:hypothetical protein
MYNSAEFSSTCLFLDTWTVEYALSSALVALVMAVKIEPAGEFTRETIEYGSCEFGTYLRRVSKSLIERGYFGLRLDIIANSMRSAKSSSEAIRAKCETNISIKQLLKAI